MWWLAAAYACNLLLALSRAADCAHGRTRIRALAAQLQLAHTPTDGVASGDRSGSAGVAEMWAYLLDARKQLMLMLQVRTPAATAAAECHRHSDHLT